MAANWLYSVSTPMKKVAECLFYFALNPGPGPRTTHNICKQCCKGHKFANLWLQHYWFSCGFQTLLVLLMEVKP